MLCDGIKFLPNLLGARDEERKKFSYAPHLDSKGGKKSIMKYLYHYMRGGSSLLKIVSATSYESVDSTVLD